MTTDDWKKVLKEFVYGPLGLQEPYFYFTYTNIWFFVPSLIHEAQFPQVGKELWMSPNDLQKLLDAVLYRDFISPQSRALMLQDRLWTKVWNMGCWEGDLKQPGDYVVTQLGKESIVLTRDEDGGVIVAVGAVPRTTASSSPPGIALSFGNGRSPTCDPP